jgi:hypothetical protein
MEHKKQSKSQKQYLRGIIHNLSLQRWTDQEIVGYLNDEKKIDIARSTVNGIKNKIEKEAEKWYIELRNSRYKYIATYKERLDSLLSYQKKLNDIISANKKPEVQIRAISELHSIEISIFNLWKQLPDLTIVDDAGKDNSNGLPDPNLDWPSTRKSLEELLQQREHMPRVLDDASYSPEENAEYYRELVKKYEERIDEYKKRREGENPDAWTV